jgi:hypothetical protein
VYLVSDAIRHSSNHPGRIASPNENKRNDDEYRYPEREMPSETIIQEQVNQNQNVGPQDHMRGVLSKTVVRIDSGSQALGLSLWIAISSRRLAQFLNKSLNFFLSESTMAPHFDARQQRPAISV